MTYHPMRLGRFCTLFAFLAFLVPALAPAQQRSPSGLPAPRLYQMSPAGAKVGSTVEVVVAGRHLEEPEKLVFSNAAIKAELVPAPVPEIDPKTKKPKAAMGGLPADHFKFKVTVPAGVALGNVDVRVVNKYGVSNPRAFVLGDLNEVAEKEPNNDVEQAQKVDLNTTVNGTINSAADVDYYVFTAKKGQRILVSCLASSIDSRAQPEIEIYNKKDQPLTSNRNYSDYDAVTDVTIPEDGDYYVRLFQFTHTLRPAMPNTMPTGSSDHYYRLNITTAPWIDAVFPNTIEPGKTTAVTIYGRNLPEGKLDPAASMETATGEKVTLEKITVNVTAPADGKGKLTFSGKVAPSTAWLDGFEYRVKNASGSSNPVLFNLAKAPVILETGDNDTLAKAQKITLPCEIAGQVEKRGDRDWFTFTAKKGETWTFDVISNRLGAPTYMMIALQAPMAKTPFHKTPLVENMQGYSRKFFSRSEDPTPFRYTFPADGEYQLLVTSRTADSHSGVRLSYAVRITREESDFSLISMSHSDYSPDVVNVPIGGQDAYTVMVERKGDFAGDVELSVEGLPPGLVCAPQTLAAGVRETTLVLTAQAAAAAWAGEIKIKGTAMVGAAKVTRESRPASIIWPIQGQDGGNATTLSRLDRSNWLSVKGKAPFTLTPSIDKVEVVPGDKATVKVKLNRLWPDIKQPVQVALMQSQGRQGSEIPTNLRFNNNQPSNIAAGAGEASIPVTIGTDVPPGTYNIVFRGQTTVPFNKDTASKAKQNTIIVVPSEPLRVVVLPKTLATLSLGTTTANVKIGGQTELVVRVARQYKFSGEFKVQVVLPPGVTGVSAAEVTIPAGQDEAKLVLAAPAGTNPGGRNNLVVKATAMYNGKPIVHETKLNVNVVK